MARRRAHVAVSAAQNELAVSLAALRTELGLPTGFPADALAEAEAVRSATPPPERDLRELPFATIDPAGSTDLDQAFHLSRTERGFRVRYAIADVPGFVRPAGAVDRVARGRGQTLYAADGRVPLHPPVLSEDRASLLAGAERSAYVWSFELDGDGVVTRTGLERALVRSRAQLDYDGAQAEADRGDPDSPVALLGEIGRARIEQERARGGASLNSPEEIIVRAGDGTYSLERRRLLPVEEWNAQLSLMTGMAAAELMLAGRIGVLRTMPAPDGTALAAFRRRTEALGRPWAEGVAYGEYLRALDRDDPVGLAVLQAAGGLFRGAGYVTFDGEVPAAPLQSALAAPYAHVTAPLRRLVDRWGLVVCEALVGGREIPAWLRESLGLLPGLMEASSQLASRLEGASVARVEAAVLHGRVGERFEATVIELRGDSAIIQLADPAVTASCPSPDSVRPGERIEVVLEHADIRSGSVRFTAG